MRIVTLAAADDFEGWRDTARRLAADDVAADQLVWRVTGEVGDLFGAVEASAPPSLPSGFSVPRRFIDLARLIVCHSDPERFALLYVMLRKLRDMPSLIDDQTDPLLRR